MSDVETAEPKKTRKPRKPKAEAEAVEADAAPQSSEPRLVKRDLLVELTTNERLSKGSELAECEEEIDRIEDARKAFNDTKKAERELVEQRRATLASTLRLGKERKEVTCSERFIFETGTVEVVRLDSGEIVEKRAMTYHERNPTIPGVDVEPTPVDHDAIDDPQQVLDAASSEPDAFGEAFDHSENDDSGEDE